MRSPRIGARRILPLLRLRGRSSSVCSRLVQIDPRRQPSRARRADDTSPRCADSRGSCRASAPLRRRCPALSCKTCSVSAPNSGSPAPPPPLLPRRHRGLPTPTPPQSPHPPPLPPRLRRLPHPKRLPFARRPLRPWHRPPRRPPIRTTTTKHPAVPEAA